MFLTAWAVWNGHGNVIFADMIERLDDSNLETLGTLLVAFGNNSTDEWLEAERLKRIGFTLDPPA